MCTLLLDKIDNNNNNNNKSDSVFLIDIAIPVDSRVSSKTIEKLTKYADLKLKL